jgi:DNA polymerase
MLFNLARGPSLALPECHKCGLYKNCASPKMPPSGSGRRRILFVGEAPGKDEDRLGSQFVGVSGQYLRKILRELKCDLDECRVTNSIICHPPNNKMSAKYLTACAPSLKKVLREEKFDVIITLGEWALQQVIPEAYRRYGGGMGKWRGWTIPLVNLGCYLCPVYHPSYVLRTGEDAIIAREFKSDLRNALSRRKPGDLPNLEELKSRVEVVKSPRQRFEDLARRKGLLAFDYETTGLKPDATQHRIVSCSFCFEGEDTWACKITDEELPLLAKVLFSKKLKKIASNLKFEERWTRAKLGRGVAGWHWDTMLAAHILDNRPGITSVKFQSFVRLGIGGWEEDVLEYLKSGTANSMNRIDMIPTNDLLVYNGMDSLLEFQVMVDQKKELGV